MKVQAIFGPPGTGKTRQLVDYASSEEGAIFLSYTKAAAAEATSRIPRLRPSTIHSLAFNELNMNRAAVVDRAKMAAFGKATGIPFKGTEKGNDEEQEGDEYATTFQYSRNAVIDPIAAYEHFGCPGTRNRYERFVKEYESWKGTYGYMDFDDMLTLYSRNGRGRARVVFLDEAQDCTPLQWAAFERAVERAERVFIAGDDDQAIYQWSGADPHGMINFMNRFNGELLVLNQSHRLPHCVWAYADQVITQIDNRVPKTYGHADREGTMEHYRDLDFVMDRLERLAPDGALILTRDRFKLAEAKRVLNKEMIPYEVFGDSSPWTSKIARAIKSGEITKTSEEIPVSWRSFYRDADLTLPIKYFLSTIHSAKGREHETVIMDFDMPNRVLLNCHLDRDAEVRVQYVGITRSKSRLFTCGENPILGRNG